MKNIFLSLIFLFQSTFTAKSNKSKSDHCTLTEKPSKDPFPSLVKCYKYNNEACCMSVHDDYISNYISTLLTDPCLRKYSEFEDLMCLACHPLESNYVDPTNKKIRICEDFAMRLWNASEEDELNKPTDIFDNCGFKSDNFDIDDKFIIPSKHWNNFSHFFTDIRVPLFEDFDLIIITNGEQCYNIGGIQTLNFIICIFCMIFVLL
jgi:hypothetical protein